MFGYYGLRYKAILITSDLLLTMIALLFSLQNNLWFVEHSQEVEPSTSVLILSLGVWFVVFNTRSIYDCERQWNTLTEFERLLVASIFALLVLTGILYLTSALLPPSYILGFFAAELLLLFGNRLGLQWARQFEVVENFFQHRVIIVGANALGQHADNLICQKTWTGLKVVGFLDDDANNNYNGKPVFGTIKDITQIVQTQKIEEVIIALPQTDYQKLIQVMLDLRMVPVYVHAVPDQLSFRLYEETAKELGGLLPGLDLSRNQNPMAGGQQSLQLINLRAPVLTLRQYFVKRVFDFFVATLFLTLALPLMVVIGLAIKFDSPGPVFFRQERVGENGRLFKMYKFRSMVKDAEARQQEVIRQDENNNIVHKSPSDPRVTRVGQIIRRTSLDELPQLLNVLKGDMSLVGPRPEMPWLVEQYGTWQFKRFTVPQGMTGWWQVNGRANRLMHMNTDDDLYYVQNYSLLLDIRILLKTLPAVIKRSGAF